MRRSFILRFGDWVERKFNVHGRRSYDEPERIFKKILSRIFGNEPELILAATIQTVLEAGKDILLVSDEGRIAVDYRMKIFFNGAAVVATWDDHRPKTFHQQSGLQAVWEEDGEVRVALQFDGDKPVLHYDPTLAITRF